MKGFVQIPGVDFTDSFAPVVTDTGLQILFAIALYTKDFVCEIVDVEAAFLEADMDKQIYIEWPEGVAEFGYKTDKTIHRDCILLDKAMYGTVQAARQWFKKLCKSLEKVGLVQSKSRPLRF